VLRFRHPERGELTFGLLNPLEVQAAITQLKDVLAERLIAKAARLRAIKSSNSPSSRSDRDRFPG